MAASGEQGRQELMILYCLRNFYFTKGKSVKFVLAAIELFNELFLKSTEAYLCLKGEALATISG